MAYTALRAPVIGHWKDELGRLQQNESGGEMMNISPRWMRAPPGNGVVGAACFRMRTVTRVAVMALGVMRQAGPRRGVDESGPLARRNDAPISSTAGGP